MTLTWGAPAALWLLLGVPLVWLADLVARTNFNPRQRLLQKIVRSLLLTALALGLARPVISSSSSHQSIVYAVDVSHSVASHAIEAAAGEDRRAERRAAAVALAHRHVRPGCGHARRRPRRCGSSPERARRRRRREDPTDRRRISRPRSTRRAASWRRSTCPGSCSSATAIRPPATPVRRSRASPRREFPCRSSRSRRARSAIPGSTRSTCPPASPAAPCSPRRSRSAASAAIRARSSCG